MHEKHLSILTEEMGLEPWQLEGTAELLAEGATIPFISRYRKERTGSLDEVAVARIRDRLEQLEELDKRRESILATIAEQGKLTPDLTLRIMRAESLAVLEDLYLPYRPKRRTRGTMAKEKGLEPLAARIFEQGAEGDPDAAAEAFVDPEKGVGSAAEALQGARDIIAEWVNEHQEARALLRSLFERKGTFQCKVVSGKEEEASKYRDYFDWEEPVSTAPSHRVLAMRRGEKEGLLTLRIAPPEESALEILEAVFVKGASPLSEQVWQAVQDGYRRLLSHGLETEIRLQTKKRADEEAIRIFAENLRQLLLAPPLGEKRVMGIDPGFRTGCKVVCLNAQGRLEHNETIYPLLSGKARAEAGERVRALCDRFAIQAIAVGNGTGGRETETFLRDLKLPASVQVVMVNESGASVYSASEVAREEFSDYDLTVRGAVSIGRRLMDPLAELVKIDPKSIGVGQYQHDVDQRGLKAGLDDVVMSCVNAVGVDVNTASRQLLMYVSGLGPQLAGNVVAFRDRNGPFRSRGELMDVPRLGSKAFEQSAGFLRIRDGLNPLDASAVHPESYPIVETMATDLGCEVVDLIQKEAVRQRIRPERYVNEKVGLPTLRDILDELAKPGRDPRERFEAVQFDEGIQTIGDLRPGMHLPGIVTNITAFGAFVDIGVHQDGLVHISEMADRFVKDPGEVVKVQQKVLVRVLDIDTARQRIALSMRTGGGADAGREERPGPGGRGGHSAKRSNPPRESAQSRQFNNPFAKVFSK
ncbi:Tex family protein [Desulfatiglans anilini]|uniref:Tex family protein n=1 Tax=Desulfatiglans anilini TaxID=90728 RepID=UPI00040CA349|nr:Tex family protein [Desulfatiglans anilini]